MTNRETLCRRCSKPVPPGRGQVVGGETLHVRCAARATGLESLEMQERARPNQSPAGAPSEGAGDVIAGSPTRVCVVCSRPLASGGGVLFRGDRLVHASCWRPESAAPKPASPGGEPAALQIWVGNVLSIDRTRRRLVVGTQEFAVAPDVPLDDVQVGVSVRVLYEPERRRIVEARRLSG